MTDHLSALGMPSDAEVLYRCVLRSDPAPLTWHATTLGWQIERSALALAHLTELGLVQRDRDGTLSAEPPRVALERLIDIQENDLEGRRRALSTARRAIGQFTAEHRGRRYGPTDATPLLSRVREVASGSVVERLTQHTTGVIRACNLTFDTGPATDESAMEAVRDLVGSGRELRMIQPMSILDSAHGRDVLHKWNQAGARQRVLQDPPAEFVVFGDQAVFGQAEWGRIGADHVLIEEPLVVAAFAEVFDRTWARSSRPPFAASGEDEDRVLLGLLARGMKDEAISRYLGCGLRTVRRRVARLMEEVGAASRFTLGARAQRMGLLGDIEVNAR